MVILILIGAMLLVGVPLYIHYRISGSPSANKPMPRSQSSWHHHHPSGKPKRPASAKAAQTKTAQANANKAKMEGGAVNTLETTNPATSASASATPGASQNPEDTKTETSEVASGTVEANPSAQAASQQLQQDQEQESEVCCGLHEVCEKLATNPTKVEYFDDEELDQFAGRDAQSYNDDEIDQFRDVMTTMYPSEVALWRQSLALRGIALPVELEDEFMLILSEV